MAARARLVLLIACLGLVACGLALRPGSGLRSAGGPERGDTALYRAIEQRVAAGQPYSSAAVAEHRRRGYPLRPFVAVRPPALALFMQAVGGADVALLLLRLLGAATAFATVLALGRDGVGRGVGGAAGMSLLFSLALLAQPALVWWHEAWAGVLVLLTVALRRPKRWGASLAVGLAAVLVREFALLLPVVMAAAAGLERRRGEVVGWALVLLAGVAALADHAWTMAAVVGPDDLRSPGWLATGGWRFVLSAARSGSPLLLLPPWVTAVLVPVALFGWAATPGPVAHRAAALLAGWMAAFMVLGRPDNGYWGLLLAPLLAPGVVLGVAAGGQVWRRRHCGRARLSRSTPM